MADTESTPQDTMSPLDTSATLAHEAYLAYRRAGFTDKQALRLLGHIIANNGSDQ